MTQATPLTIDSFSAPRITHGFFTRQGGVSEGIYRSLNCGPGSQDDPTYVETNRKRVLSYFPQASQLITLSQTHSSDVISITNSTIPERTVEGDALVTNQTGVVLGILTADCTPVLFADRERGIIGAAHAGWRGAFDGVLENTLQSMVDLGADKSSICTAIGPCIYQESYEVDQNFYEKFIASTSKNETFFKPSTNKHHHLFDLPGYVIQRLTDAGVTQIENVKQNTYTDSELFFSWRRSFHEGQTDYGRQISAISLEEIL